MTRFVTDPKTGRMRTEESGPPIDIEKARRECRDVIQGNVQFHTDPFTPRKQEEIRLVCYCSFLGETCAVCEPGRGDA